jgi:hypothetical protein
MVVELISWLQLLTAFIEFAGVLLGKKYRLVPPHEKTVFGTAIYGVTGQVI